MKDKWDQRYAAPTFAYGKEPNVFLRETLDQYQPRGRALFPAEGEGRNAVYAAEQGLLVEAFDLSTEGRKKALALAAARSVVINYQTGDFRQLGYQPASFDLLVLIYAHFPAAQKQAFNQQLATYLKPGGLVIFEGFGQGHLPLRQENPAVGGPNVPEMLFSVPEMEATFPDFEVLYLAEEVVTLNEGHYHQGKGSVVRFVGRKR